MVDGVDMTKPRIRSGSNQWRSEMNCEWSVNTCLGRRPAAFVLQLVCNQRAAVAGNQIKIARYKIATESSAVSRIPRFGRSKRNLPADPAPSVASQLDALRSTSTIGHSRRLRPAVMAPAIPLGADTNKLASAWLNCSSTS
jgi:hypothetical protein